MKKSYLIITLTFISFIPSSFAQQNVWIYKTSMSAARTFLSACVLDNYLYVIGGCPNSAATSIVEMYNPITDTWSKINDLPSARCYAMTCTYGNKIYVFGGATGMWSNAVKSVYVYDPQTGSWAQKADMPYAIGGSGIAVVEDKIYLIGGALNASSTPVSTVMVYDPLAESWTQKADLITPRNMLSASVIDGKIYAIGGTTEYFESDYYKHVEVYDPIANTWTRKADMPTGRWGLVTCIIDGRIYAIGGRFRNSCSMNEVYDPIVNTWLTKAPMQQVRTGLAAGVINNKIYATGGHIGPPMIYNSSIEEYNPDDLSIGPNFFSQPIEFLLLQNYPNPFNPSTTFRYSIPNQSRVTIKVFDMLGNEIATLIDEEKNAGSHKIEFNGNHLPSGIYFYRICAGNFTEVKKMILLK